MSPLVALIDTLTVAYHFYSPAAADEFEPVNYEVLKPPLGSIRYYL